MKKSRVMKVRTEDKKYRFFYHYRKETGGMTIHYKGTCYPVEDVKCNVPCETHKNKQQPKLVMRGFCKEIKIENGLGIIN